MKALLRNSILGVLVLLAFAPRAEAYPPCCDSDTERVSLTDYELDLKSGHSRVFSLPEGWRRVEKVYIRAYSRWGSATMQVNVNGDRKASVYVPEQDPYYVINVSETTSSITIWNRGPGTLRIQSFEADLNNRWYQPVRPITPYPRPAPDYKILNEAAQLANECKKLIDKLRPYADPATEYVVYLLPIKVAAGRALAVANARGNGSGKTRAALEVLEKSVAFAAPYIEASLKKEASFDLATDLLSMEDKIADWLD